MSDLLVVGSCNTDLVFSMDHFPAVGETLLGESMEIAMGGKGANQAVAAARLGMDVDMIGCVGNDVYGKLMLDNFKKNGIKTEHVEIVEQSSGLASIYKSENDNHIVVIPGANQCVDAEYVRKYENCFKQTKMIVLQYEIPKSGIKEAMKLAKRYGAIVLFNPAPYQTIDEEMFSYIDILTPNETEFKDMCKSDESLEECIKKFHQDHPQIALVITLGSKGSCYVEANSNEVHYVASRKVEVIDTTGAGDTFSAALACATVRGEKLEDAVNYASCAASLSITKFSAQGGMPSHNEVIEFMK